MLVSGISGRVAVCQRAELLLNPEYYYGTVDMEEETDSGVLMACHI